MAAFESLTVQGARAMGKSEPPYLGGLIHRTLAEINFFNTKSQISYAEIFD
ncbi:MAG: hypothetical protein KBS34_00095 [Phascolarctobacterium sp.]|nr:hypothetical protein [Candidatus Phascolarctobacterium equi]